MQNSNNFEIEKILLENNIQIYGFTRLNSIKKIPSGLGFAKYFVLRKFKYAVVFGIPLVGFHSNKEGNAKNMVLESIANEILELFEKKHKLALIIHPEDEVNPIKRVGLFSLKVLAKEAGIGWQGKSLLVISPEFGAIHRLIAILTDMELSTTKKIENQCGDCSLCIINCPRSALKNASYKNYPKKRNEVIDIDKCLGDFGCKVCLEICPWNKK